MDLQTIGVSISGSAAVAFAIVKTLMRSEARTEMTPDIKELHERATKIEDEFVSCKFCDRQHDTLNTTLQSMDKKLDLLIAQK
jgi:hypothetical protein